MEKLLQASRTNRSLLCIGLDPDPELMPKLGVPRFNREIVDATSDLVCAYKPNLAFYEALGIEGLKALEKTIAYIPKGIPIIGDAKRGDIGSTARAYARALFEAFGFDAATINPYLGYDSVEPFIEYRDKGVFILCRTSNAGSADFQALSVSESFEPSREGEKPEEVGETDGKPAAPAKVERSEKPLFEIVARRAREWNTYGNVGLVVGATYFEELRLVRQLCPDMPLLIPGIGAQGGDLANAVRYGVDADGQRAIISSSRQIIYARKGEDFAMAAREAALRLRDEINRYRGAT